MARNKKIRIPDYGVDTRAIIESANTQVEGILRSIEDAKRMNEAFDEELKILEAHKAEIQKAIDQLKLARNNYVDVVSKLSNTSGKSPA